MGLFSEEITASEGVYENMKEFSAYTIKSKFPNVIDGLKPIHRRILLTLHKKPDEVAKEATIAGRVMEMHPHGDASISAAIAGLAKPYANIVPLVESSSNLGTYDGEDPAAARYVDVKHAETSEDLFFRNTNFASLKFVACESEKGVEPTNFVPVIPTALIMPVLGIGCGFKTETSAISLQNTCIAAKKFVEMKYRDPDNYRKKIFSLAPYLIPDFTSACYLRNSHQIISEYKKGNFDCPFILDGIMDVTKTSIIFSTLPPDKSFGKVTQDAGSKTHLDKNSWFHEHFQDMACFAGSEQGCTIGNYECILRRGENPFELLAMLKKQMQFTSIWKPTLLYYDDERGMSRETPLTLIDKWADARYKVVLGGLKQRLIELQEQYRKLMALSIVVDHAEEVCAIFNQSKDRDATVYVLSKRFNLSLFQAKYLQKLPLEKLTSAGKQELLDEIEEVKKKNSELQKKFTKIPEEIISDIEYIEKKYSEKYPAKCVVKEFIGTACYKGTGWILVETMKEFDSVLTKFDSEDIQLNLFQESGPVTVIGSDDPERDPYVDVAKYLHASYVNRIGCRPKHLALHIRGGNAFVPLPNSSGLIENDPVPVNDTCTIITKSEGRQIVSVDAKNKRLSMNITSPAIKDVLYTSPIVDEEVLVVHCNTKVPGVVTVDRVIGNGKISRTVVGETKIIGVYKVNKPIMFSIPNEVAVRTAIRHMYFKDLAKYVEVGKPLKLQLTRKKTSNEMDLAPYANRSAIFTIKE